MPNTTQNAPTNVEEIATSMQDTVLGIWADFVNHSPFLVMGALILLFTWGISALAARLMDASLRHSKMRGSLRELFVRLLSIGIWITGILLAAMVTFPGLTPARALSAMGIVSIAVGFAFKDIFENFFAGILLLWRFPFEKGDFIECEGISGQVEHISVRQTLIRQTSGELVIAPNSFLFLNPTKVLTNLPRRRITIITGIAYGENVTEAVRVIEHAVDECRTVHKDRPLEIFPQAFGASSIDIEVTWWADPTPVDVRRSRGEVVTAIKGALDEAGIEIPFPYRTLTFKHPLETVSLEKSEGEIS
ncbi:mechanosensitive ion channel family protein [Nitrosococcus oceani]|uniref:Small-conductance mechanosensitive channel n=2 Tax=Nitrosococcus oceani TaxID=1229 RepID=Q3JEV5_NITOC|nr:mechanosensitive ion channel family protein [Nitrosococcus oceani]KFI20886.1 mechanosensitive ion channel protein MscS [Nitrosococcus oceani C-27]ABA56641.1 MscS Mechanosensitive ion channel [Nitrosococcus oceani ATCC 19707]EDZ66124.1 transporter, MscS family [Nitrosococcus oceani AFC27]KFI24025.1 mechanosensitive ion channel protein MscS [Nitrosococcus oceani]GEM20789.1 mechanosensitive ion channel protein MscS [Nitrosococcus oceani]